MIWLVGYGYGYGYGGYGTDGGVMDLMDVRT